VSQKQSSFQKASHLSAHLKSVSALPKLVPAKKTKGSFIPPVNKKNAYSICNRFSDQDSNVLRAVSIKVRLQEGWLKKRGNEVFFVQSFTREGV